MVDAGFVSRVPIKCHMVSQDSGKWRMVAYHCCVFALAASGWTIG